MTPGLSLTWVQITVPTALWCIKLIVHVFKCLHNKTHVPTTGPRNWAPQKLLTHGYMLIVFTLMFHKNISLCLFLRQDATPVCTPSLLERRKSTVVDDDVDDEVVVKVPTVEREEEENDDDDGEGDEDSSEEEEDDSEEPSEEEEEEEAAE